MGQVRELTFLADGEASAKGVANLVITTYLHNPELGLPAWSIRSNLVHLINTQVIEACLLRKAKTSDKLLAVLQSEFKLLKATAAGCKAQVVYVNAGAPSSGPSNRD